MSGVTRYDREQAWNVRFFVDQKVVAGVYQQGDLLLVADIARELDLCLIFNPPDIVPACQPALLSTHNASIIILDCQDKTPIPTPLLNEVQDYHYVFHSSQCTRDEHTLTGNSTHPPIACLVTKFLQMLASILREKRARIDGSTHVT